MKKRVIEFIFADGIAVLFLSGCKKNVGTPEDNPVVEEDEESVEPAKIICTDTVVRISKIRFIWL